MPEVGTKIIQNPISNNKEVATDFLVIPYQPPPDMLDPQLHSHQ
jgi:hypothetical protein